MIWKPDWMLRALLAWTAVTTLPFWLVLVRSVMDGDSYEWGFFSMRGYGLHGDLWLPAVIVPLAVAIRWLGWRGVRPPFHALLPLWLVPIGVGATYLSITRPEDFTFRGDTMGLSIPLAPVGIVLFGGIAALAVFWVVRDLRSGRRRERLPWTRGNTILVSGLLALLPIQLILLRFGEPHGTTDKIGVVITIVQWLLLGAALRPRKEPSPARRSRAGSSTRRPEGESLPRVEDVGSTFSGSGP
jgi:hypothetical protein